MLEEFLTEEGGVGGGERDFHKFNQIWIDPFIFKEVNP